MLRARIDSLTTATPSNLLVGLTVFGLVALLGACPGSPPTAATCQQNETCAQLHVPAAPTAVLATAGIGLATISWTAPADGGSPITGYTVAAMPGNATVSATSTTATLSGLSAGSTYVFTVFATNAVGNGPASAPSASITLPAVPDAPTEVFATAGIGQATVAWTAPADGGSPIVSYVVTASPGGATATVSATTAIMTELAAGTTYTFTVCATNAVGHGPSSEASPPVTLPGVPAAPTGVSAVAGIQQATVTWTAPPDDGGPITGYTVTASPGGATGTATARTCTVTGLTSGTTYTFTVVATNAVGDGPPSAPSTPVTLPAVPDAPLDVAATAGIGAATVTWGAPQDNGSPVIGYTVMASPGGSTLTVTATTATFAGLANGQTYSFSVVATNGVGSGPPAFSATSLTLPGLPGAPTAVSATAGIGAATVTWMAPATNGSAITSYTVAASPGSATVTIVDSTTATMTGLLNGGTYTFTVFATNAVGNGPPSAASSPITLPAVPEPPDNVVAVAGIQEATVTWSVPGDGGSAITGYSVSANPGGASVTTAGATTTTITGLTSGQSYTFTVTATNAVGTGPASQPSNVITLPTLPGAPLNVFATAGDQLATVTWAPPLSDGGNAITSYTVATSPGGVRLTVSGVTTVTVTGLSNGSAYSFTVFATNGVGNGPPSVASSAVVPIAVPGAPSGVAATAGDQLATVSWVAPGSSGGTPVTGYLVLANPGGSTVSTTGATTVLFPGLVNGTSYTFTVSATNAAGIGPASAPSTAVTPFGVPDAPTNVSAIAGAAEATVTWTAPADEGAAITSYTVTSAPGGLTATATGTTAATVTGLTNGQSYTFTVFATNAAGNGPSSGPSAAVTPLGLPGAPTGVSATPGLSQATVTWSPPDDGGSPIISYAVTVVQTGVVVSVSVATATITGLTAGASYTFTVSATTAVGTGPSSAPSAAITLPTVPGAPINVVAVPGMGQATTTWTAPGDGGSSITSYTVTSSPGTSVATTTGATTATITGLTNGQSYSFTVSATNAVGTGPSSTASAAITLPSVPGAPIGVVAVAGVGQATVTWTAPNDDGSPITGYTVTSSPGDFVVTTTGATTATITGLTSGQSYTFAVSATNSVGTGPSASSASTTIPTVPGAPTGVTATANGSSVTVTWTAPDDGGSAITSDTVTLVQTGATVTVTSGTSATFPGLPAGSTDTFTVSATNAVGSGPASAASNAVTIGASASATTSTLTASPASFMADGTAASELTATIKDASGDPLTGLTVTFSASGSSDTLLPISAVTNANGVATSSLTTTVAQSELAYATVGGVMLSASVTATALPAARADFTISYDATRGVTDMFGGDAFNTFQGDTWTWNGTTWTQLAPATSPSKRDLSAMAYDSTRGVTVLFGGDSATGYMADTWEWNGTTWTERFPTTSPQARVWHSMVYDSGRQVTVLFGGQAIGGASLDDTWEWNGTTWTELFPTTSPPARNSAAMTYDASQGVTILFGGGSSTALNDTWEWNGTNWTEMTPALMPPKRIWHAMAYDALHAVTVLFGGDPDANTFLSDTWEWDAATMTWTEESPGTVPHARSSHGMAFDSARGVIVMFGGVGVPGTFLEDTWEWNGTNWTERSPG